MPTLRRSSTTKSKKTKTEVRKTRGSRTGDDQSHGPLPSLISELIRVGLVLAKSRF